jgi:hypothetical protein
MQLAGFADLIKTTVCTAKQWAFIPLKLKYEAVWVGPFYLQEDISKRPYECQHKTGSDLQKNRGWGRTYLTVSEIASDEHLLIALQAIGID